MENANKPAYPGNLEIDNQRYLTPAKVEIVDAYNKILRENGTKNEGLTKREIFAMSAMNGILAGNDYKSRSKANQISACQASIEMADELLKQLNPAEINK